jgi:hypothetical protein
MSLGRASARERGGVPGITGSDWVAFGAADPEANEFCGVNTRLRDDFSLYIILIL